MPLYKYVAAPAGSATDSGTRSNHKRGTIAAETPRQAREELRRRGMRVHRISEATSGKSRTIRLGNAHEVAWANAVDELSMMLGAGIPMLEALETIAEQSRGVFRSAILEVIDNVAAGSSLADALEKRPDLFDEASVHMVQVGENSGTLDTVLAQLAKFKRRSLSLKDSVTTAMVYPCFLVVFGTGAGIFLMTSVLPPLLENLMETIDELPWPTRVAQAISNVLLNYGLWIALVLALAVIGLVVAVRTPRGRRAWHQFVFRLPLLGPMAAKQGVSRIAMVVGTLIRSGVELPRAIELAARSTKNQIHREALEKARSRIQAGEEIADALAASGAFPPLAVRVFSVGQESGKLDDMLFRLADDYDTQVATASTRFTALLEPVLILVLAVAVGFLLLATILP
ncbi:MAG: type II secretion system F family protein, partial [Planctomycetota bacterium]